MIKLPKANYAVKTLAANTFDCVTDCPTNSLSDYVTQVGGYAGLNGTYFCPPDYGSCAGRINSYDYPVFDSVDGTWLNEGAVTWNNIALATFAGTTDNFYKAASSYSGYTIDAAISNFPMILINGEKAFDENDTTPYQETSKGARGVLGVDISNYYLAIITSATVPELVEITQNLGMVNAINLDGGGSSALYIAGQYIVGPGRSLPNAVVLVPK
ncbi:hypothetical protein CO179_00115 [candidate division WWE3 bacterium CG_4_9_14_3_um_filter_39_7]|uniref:Phosphodiester glycosidase domain-containing protein n=1 Tax=candidate division WWE3 bacterium CG_4_9_14_3_um_filter_39_7 TaxID=1975080 RepID=A0A2M7X5C1_UNCKA|nr:MAG: hypothetical protein CO179_00115 [candidate division WWE3 bacterium CG_4_9_14_3_um_filter_39_7]